MTDRTAFENVLDQTNAKNSNRPICSEKREPKYFETFQNVHESVEESFSRPISHARTNSERSFWISSENRMFEK